MTTVFATTAEIRPAWRVAGRDRPRGDRGCRRAARQALVDEFLGMQGMLPPDNGGLTASMRYRSPWWGPTISNVRSVRTGRRAWCTCRCPGTPRRRCGSTTRSVEPGTTPWAAGCSPSVGSKRCWPCSGTALRRTPLRCPAPRAYQPGPRRNRQPRPAGTSPSPPSDRRPRSTAETSTFNSSRFDPTPPGAAVTPDWDYDTACLATPRDPTRRLTAPLRGLGAAPTPLG